MSDAGKRLITSANEALDLVKRLRYEADGSEFSNRYADMAGQAADRIEQLERELVEAREDARDFAALAAELTDQLAAEKALADTLHKGVELWERAAPNSSAEAEASSYGSSARAAYRKARGL